MVRYEDSNDFVKTIYLLGLHICMTQQNALVRVTSYVIQHV